MSLREDFEASGKTAREYIRLIWDETAYSGEQFSDLDDFDDVTAIRNRLSSLLAQEETTPFRKTMYQRFMSEFFKSQKVFMEWVEDLEKNDLQDEEKWEYVARFLTKVIRGDVFRTLNPLQTAMTLLEGKKIQSVWDRYLFELEQLCNARGIK